MSSTTSRGTTDEQRATTDGSFSSLFSSDGTLRDADTVADAASAVSADTPDRLVSDSLDEFNSSDLVQNDDDRRELWLAQEFPGKLADINTTHDELPGSRQDLIDRHARQLAADYKQHGLPVVINDGLISIHRNGLVLTEPHQPGPHGNDRLFTNNGFDEVTHEDLTGKAATDDPTCPDCGGTLHTRLVQLRSADESETRITTCLDCDYKERDDD